MRGRVARSYEALASLPGPVLAKIDAAIPHLLVAESIGGSWNITDHMRDAIDLMAEFQSSGEKLPETFLKRMDMLKGKAPVDRYSQAAQALFLNMNKLKKAEYVKDFAAYAGQAKISPEAGGMGIGETQEQAAKKYLGIEPERKPVPKTESKQAEPPKPKKQSVTIVVSGNELGVPEGSDIKEYRKAAREVYRELQKTPAYREDLGEINFTAAGFGEMKKAGADPRKWKIVPRLKEIVENSRKSKIYSEKRT